MKIRNNLLLAGGCGLLMLAACQSPKDQIAKKWQMESFETPTVDSMMELRKQSIDTITQVDPQMAEFFGTTNVDSVKSILLADLENYKSQQDDAAKQGFIDFQKNGTVIFGSGPQTDSAKWAIADKNKLVLTPIKKENASLPPDTMIIENISKDKLRLKVNQGAGYMYINLHPYTKEDSITAAELTKKQMEEMQRQMQQAQQQHEATATGATENSTTEAN